MTYFDYLETMFTKNNAEMATKNPNDVTVWRQAKVNGTLQLVTMSRTFLKWVYIGYLLCKVVSIKLHLVKAPAFQSSIPNQQPSKPTLAKLNE